jgi:hypothetical protein
MPRYRRDHPSQNYLPLLNGSRSESHAAPLPPPPDPSLPVARQETEFYCAHCGGRGVIINQPTGRTSSLTDITQSRCPACNGTGNQDSICQPTKNSNASTHQWLHPSGPFVRCAACQIVALKIKTNEPLADLDAPLPKSSLPHEGPPPPGEYEDDDQDDDDDLPHLFK